MKINQPNFKKWKKKLISGRILARLAQIWAPKFFFVVLPLPDVRNCYKLSLYAISRETNESNLRKWQIVSGPILAYLAQIRATIFFLSKIFLCQSLDIMVSYHHMQYQKKLMIES